MKKLYFILVAIAICNHIHSQIIVSPDTNTVQTVNNFVLGGVATSNITYTGATNTLGNFYNGNYTNLGLSNGIIMTTGLINNPFIGSPVGTFASSTNSEPGCPELDLLSGNTTYDASILEFDLIPAGNILEFDYIFASEEYPEFVASGFNDVFAFFISGPNPLGGSYINLNIAEVPGTSLPVSIDNVNQNTNSAYFVNNEQLGGQTIVYDGFTTLLTAQVDVIPANSYHLKMAISDVGDGAFDSAIFLKAQSMKSYNSTGISEITNDLYKIYLNNNKDQLTIINQDNANNNKEIRICNLQGQNIIQHNCINNSDQINISTLPSGIYFVTISYNGNKQCMKFVK